MSRNIECSDRFDRAPFGSPVIHSNEGLLPNPDPGDLEKALNAGVSEPTARTVLGFAPLFWDGGINVRFTPDVFGFLATAELKGVPPPEITRIVYSAMLSYAEEMEVPSMRVTSSVLNPLKEQIDHYSTRKQG